MATKPVFKDERKGQGKSDYVVLKDHVKELARELKKHESEPMSKAHPSK